MLEIVDVEFSSPHFDESTCNGNPGMTRKKVPGVLTVGFALLVVGWMVFHPDKCAELSEVKPELVQRARGLLASVPVKPAVLFVRFKESDEGVPRTREVTTEVLENGVLRRRSVKKNAENSLGILQESTSLALGPVLLVRHNRQPPPFVGDLLPNRFWTSRRIARIEGRTGQTFPPTGSERFVATAWFETHYDSGAIDPAVPGEIACTSLEYAPATKVSAALPGAATLIQCDEIWPVDEKMHLAISHEFKNEIELKGARQLHRSNSWYLHDFGVTVQIQSEEGILLADGSKLTTATIRTVERIDLRPPST